MSSTEEDNKNEITSDSNGQNGTPSSRTTPHGTPKRDSISLRSLRKSTRLSVYLYIVSHYKLSDEQREFVANFQAKLNLAEIQSALKFLHTLTTDPRTRRRMKIPESQERVETLVPTLRSRPKRPEQRRIGVGYRDKGSLPKRSRPDWEKDNTIYVGLSSTQLETRSWDLTILRDPPESPELEKAEGLVAEGSDQTQTLDHLWQSGHTLENTAPGVWKISLPKDGLTVYQRMKGQTR